MAHPTLVTIGGSAGALAALREIVAALGADLPAAVAVVIHASARLSQNLADLLNGLGRIPVRLARDGEPIPAGVVLLPAGDRHLVFEPGRVRLSSEAKVNGFRPSVDRLFESAARLPGARVVGVVLSGGLDDGSDGLARIKHAGGHAIVQDPAEAFESSMPEHAIANTSVDEVLPAARIGAAIRSAVEGGALRPLAPVVPAAPPVQNPPSDYTCPSCGGILRLRSGRPLHFVCQVGHSFTLAGLDHGQQQCVEEALWSAMRLLEERRQLLQDILRGAAAKGVRGVVDVYQRRLDELHRQIDVLRVALGADREAGRADSG